MVSTKLMTAEDLLALGSDAPYELIHGELQPVRPTSSRPSMISAFIGGQIDAYLRKRRLGIVTVTDGGYILSTDPDTVVAPDVAVVRKERIPPGHDFDKYFPGAPDLAIEVTSPSDSPSDILRKLALYTEANVPLVWIVYPKHKKITVHRIGEPPLTLDIHDHVSGDDILPGLSIRLSDVFSSTIDE